MSKKVNKVKICISLDIDVYELLKKECEETDAKISTKINRILNESVKKKR